MPLPFQQHPNFADCLRAEGRDMRAMPGGILLRRRVWGLPVSLVSRGGAAMVAPSLAAPGMRLFNAEDAIVATQLRRSGFWQIERGQEVAEWDISVGSDRLLAGLRKSWRQDLEKGLEHVEVALRPMEALSDHWLLHAEAAQARRRGYRPWPHWLALRWAELHPSDALLVEARLAGLRVAGMLFLRHGTVATYHISFARLEGRSAQAPRAMLWRAVQHLAAQGVQRLDLGQTFATPLPGLARFKLGTGAKARTLGGTWLGLPGLSALKRQLSRPKGAPKARA